jgi:hypothetical protein
MAWATSRMSPREMRRSGEVVADDHAFAAHGLRYILAGSPSTTRGRAHGPRSCHIGGHQHDGHALIDDAALRTGCTSSTPGTAASSAPSMGKAEAARGEAFRRGDKQIRVQRRIHPAADVIVAGRAMPARPITSATDRASAATVPEVRRGACSRLSAARAPSTGRPSFRSGRSSRVSQVPRWRASAAASHDAQQIAGVEEHRLVPEEARRPPRPPAQAMGDPRRRRFSPSLITCTRPFCRPSPDRCRGGRARRNPAGDQAGHHADDERGKQQARVGETSSARCATP